jgi:hypothetical protein
METYVISYSVGFWLFILAVTCKRKGCYIYLSALRPKDMTLTYWLRYKSQCETQRCKCSVPNSYSSRLRMSCAS